MKKDGVHIFTVAVGEANIENVGALASKPLSKYFYNVTNEDMLPLILHKMIWNMCVRDTDRDGNFPTLIAPAAVPRQPSHKALTAREVKKSNVDNWCKKDGDCVDKIGPTCRPNEIPKCMLDECYCVKHNQKQTELQMNSQAAVAAPFDCGTASAARWVTFTNKGLNPLRINMCSLDFNKQVCKGGPAGTNVTYTTCDATRNNKGADALSFIPPNASVALRLDLNVTYIVAIYCVDNAQSIHCLEAPTPLEFYGPTPEGGKPWPAELVVPTAVAPYCSNDRDCVAPYTRCNTSTSPPACV